MRLARDARAAAPWLILVLVLAQAFAPVQRVRAEPPAACPDREGAPPGAASDPQGAPPGDAATGDLPSCGEADPDEPEAALEQELSTTPLPEDTDGDGVPDVLEQALGTKPLRKDTDEDGVPDGVEDRNRDGVVGPGETDPRVPGLFPGTYPHIPEPMVFDLVRALGARRGEVEVNTLGVLAWGRRHAELAWAPEVEWAPYDGVGLELELPMHGRELEALKGAFQLTLPMAHAHLTHGVQVIGEHFLDQRDTEATVLYIFGVRAGKWSMLTLAGPRGRAPLGARADWELLLNPSLFREVNEWLTCGLEGNLAFGLAGGTTLAIVPQVHWQLTRAVRVQLGGGARVDHGRGEPVVVARIVLES